MDMQSAGELELKGEAVPQPMAEFGPRTGARRIIRTVLWLAATLAICGAIALLVYRRAHALPDVQYETTTADRGTVAAKFAATGNLSALLTIQVGAQVSGRLKELYVDYTSQVKKDQVIAKLDPLLFEAAVEQARALQLSATSTIEKDKA